MDWETLYVKARREFKQGFISEEEWKGFCMVLLDLMVGDYAKKKNAQLD